MKYLLLLFIYVPPIDTTDTLPTLQYKYEQFDDLDTDFYLQEIIKAFQIDTIR